MKLFSIITPFITIIIFSSCHTDEKNVSHDSQILEKTAYGITGKFFDQIKNNKYHEAFDELIQTNENINAKDSSTISLESKYDYINKYSGDFISDRLIGKKEQGDDVGVYCYLVKYEKKYYRFTFVFYNNDKNVRLYRFEVDDNLDSDMEELLKVYSPAQ